MPVCLCFRKIIFSSIDCINAGCQLIICLYFSELSIKGPVHQLKRVLSSALLLLLVEGIVLCLYFSELVGGMEVLSRHSFYLLKGVGVFYALETFLMLFVITLNAI